MKQTIVATRYAKSLLDLALEKGKLDRVKQDMKLLVETVESNRDFSLFLKNPIVKSDKKAVILKQLFKDSMDMISMGFIELVVKKKREKHLDPIAKEFLEQYDKHKQILKAVITSASGIDETTRKKVLQLITDNTKWEVELTEKTDQDILGGFILSYGDKRIDTSISHKLDKLRREFKENPFIKNF
jgi:F-type H+-transporting ATPase subunit delta